MAAITSVWFITSFVPMGDESDKTCNRPSMARRVLYTCTVPKAILYNDAHCAHNKLIVLGHGTDTGTLEPTGMATLQELSGGRTLVELFVVS